MLQYQEHSPVCKEVQEIGRPGSPQLTLLVGIQRQRIKVEGVEGERESLGGEGGTSDGDAD